MKRKLGECAGESPKARIMRRLAAAHGITLEESGGRVAFVVQTWAELVSATDALTLIPYLEEEEEERR